MICDEQPAQVKPAARGEPADGGAGGAGQPLRRRSAPPDRERSWTRVGVALSIGLAATALVWSARQRGRLQPLELAAYDALLRWQPRDLRCREKLLIVRIDERDVEQLGYPISDGTLAHAIRRLLEGGAASVAVDIVRPNAVGDPSGT